MDKLEVIIKSYCEIMILLEYGDEKARDNVLYENLKIENGQSNWNCTAKSKDNALY